jgi:eukaryotic-like serine/threonine-protein kinase
MRERKKDDTTGENSLPGPAGAPRSPDGQGDALPPGEPFRIDPAVPASSSPPPHADIGTTVDPGEAAEFRQAAPGAPGPISPPASQPPFPPTADPDFTSTRPPEAESPSPPSAPTPTIAGYEILGELGRGGMGVVYKAVQARLNRVVALKMVLAGAHASPGQLARFLTEAEAVARLAHPNIVQIYEIGEHQGLPYFSLEYVDGDSLARKIAGKPRPPGEAAGVVGLLAQAIHFAHQAGIVHRDLKPANVLLTRDGIPKLTDFGLAKRLEGDAGQTRSGTLLGTPAYMAPEQARGDIKEVSPLADTYALGVILYELLTGRPPFVGASVADTIHQIETQEPVPPRQLQPNVPRDLETICLRCLQKEPLKRFPSAEVLARDLHHFLAGEPIEARPVGSLERLWRWCKRNPRVAALSGAVLGLLVTVAVTSSVLLVKIAQEKAQTERERQAAVEARDLAQRNAVAAREAEQKAEENAVIAGEQGRLAVNTLYLVVTRVQQQLRSQPGNQKLRQELLTDAFAGLEKVARGAAESPPTRRTRAAAYQHMGDIARELGRTEDALRYYKEFQKVIEPMAADPDDQVATWNLAVVYDKLGDVNHQLLGDGAVARDYYRKCLALRQALARGPLKAPELKPAMVRDRLAFSHAKQGDLALMLGDPAEAWGHYRNFLELRQGRPFPTPRDALADTAAALPVALSLRLGEVCVHLGDTGACRGWYDRALRASRAAMERAPKSEQAQQALAACLGALGDLELQGGEASRARAHFLEAHDLLDKLAAGNPDSVPARRNLALSHYRLGTACLRLGEGPAAEGHYRQCLKLRQEVARQDPRHAYNQIDLMVILARCGRPAEAAGRAEKLRARAPQDPAVLFQVACTYALCAGAAGEKDAAGRERYAGLALEALGRAVACGYRDVVALRHDPDLDPVRDRPRFKEVVDRLTRSGDQPASPRPPTR